LIAETLFNRFRALDMQDGSIFFAAFCSIDREMQWIPNRITDDSVFGERDFSN
jgi:hypothetical protein